MYLRERASDQTTELDLNSINRSDSIDLFACSPSPNHTITHILSLDRGGILEPRSLRDGHHVSIHEERLRARDSERALVRRGGESAGVVELHVGGAAQTDRALGLSNQGLPDTKRTRYTRPRHSRYHDLMRS